MSVKSIKQHLQVQKDEVREVFHGGLEDLEHSL